MLRTLRGFAELEITGASPEHCLNRLTGKDIPFWKLQKKDAFCFTCRVYQSHLSAAEKEISAAFCSVKILRILGLPHAVRGLRKRPVLVFGMVLAFALAYLAQNWVWFVRVEGESEIPPRMILQLIEEEGVEFGAWGPGLDSQYLKNRMLNRIPALRWLAVNRDGGIAHVLVADRAQKLPSMDMDLVTNVIASTDGVITRVSVLNGFPVVEAGDAVTAGELLVTGIQEWTTHTQATRAIAEVEALTLHKLTLVSPDSALQKVYTGRSEVCRTLILKRKRIKLSGNSSIFGTKCDKMIKTIPLTLPGGYALPVSLELVTLREFDLIPSEVLQTEAERAFRTAAEETVQRGMLVGTVESGRFTISRTEGRFVCEAELYCRELISRTVPAPLFGEEVDYGQNHQRGTN